MESNEAKVEGMLNTDVELPEPPPPRKRTLRQYRQQVLASCKRSVTMMRGQTHSLQCQVNAYNKAANPEHQLRTLSTDLNLLQNQLTDVVLELNFRFAQMKLETLEKQKKQK